MFRAIIRRIKSALLYELSIVTRPAYVEAQVSMRNWQVSAKPEGLDAGLHRTLSRWRP
jgi:phage head maturation protease